MGPVGKPEPWGMHPRGDYAPSSAGPKCARSCFTIKWLYGDVAAEKGAHCVEAGQVQRGVKGCPWMGTSLTPLLMDRGL